MNETEYHKLADNTLEQLEQALEIADADGLLEMEAADGIITIAAKDKQFVVSKHVPSRQLWLSSPISGGLHFSHDAAAKDWRLADKRSLIAVLLAELAAIVGVAL